MIWLVNLAGTRYLVDEKRWNAIGRDPDNDVVLADNSVSRRHALVSIRGGAFCVRDMHSSNGTYVSGRRIGTDTTVQNGVRIRFGDVEFTVEYAQIQKPASVPSVSRIQRSKRANRIEIKPGKGMAFGVAVFSLVAFWWFVGASWFPASSTSEQTVRVVGAILIYAIVSGIAVLPIVRPPFMSWYQSSRWMIFGRGPVEILFRQIGMRISFEAFIFVVSCLFGALGGWIVVILRN
jgi:hypothetical protein